MSPAETQAGKAKRQGGRPAWQMYDLGDWAGGKNGTNRRFAWASSGPTCAPPPGSRRSALPGRLAVTREGALQRIGQLVCCICCVSLLQSSGKGLELLQSVLFGPLMAAPHTCVRTAAFLGVKGQRLNLDSLSQAGIMHGKSCH